MQRESHLLVVKCAFANQIFDVDMKLLSHAMRAVLGLQQLSRVPEELGKQNTIGSMQSQAHSRSRDAQNSSATL